jgi:hypothetical protein
MHVAEAAAERGAGFVPPGNTKSVNTRAQRGEIRCNVSRAAQSFAFLKKVDYRHGRFGGNAIRISPDVAVEHPITDDGKATPSHALKDLCCTPLWHETAHRVFPFVYIMVQTEMRDYCAFLA